MTVEQKAADWKKDTLQDLDTRPDIALMAAMQLASVVLEWPGHEFHHSEPAMRAAYEVATIVLDHTEACPKDRTKVLNEFLYKADQALPGSEIAREIRQQLADTTNGPVLVQAVSVAEPLPLIARLPLSDGGLPPPRLPTQSKKPPVSRLGKGFERPPCNVIADLNS